MSLAEYFQITVPYVESAAEGETWADVETCRTNQGNEPTGVEGKFNRLPKTDVMCREERSRFVSGFGGNTDAANNGGKGLNDPKTFVQGYARREMKATDDQYSGEHIDLFYGEAVDEKGQVGFCERQNYLDRL